LNLKNHIAFCVDAATRSEIERHAAARSQLISAWCRGAIVDKLNAERGRATPPALERERQAVLAQLDAEGHHPPAEPRSSHLKVKQHEAAA